jgi:hypothetical protein
MENITASATPLNLAQMLPAISLKDTLDVIFDQVGFTYTGSFQHTEDFSKIYILPKPKDDLGVGSGTQNTFDAQVNINQILNVISGSNYIVPIQNNLEISDPGGNYNTGTYRYTAPANGDYSFSATLRTNNPCVGASDPNFALRMYILIYDVTNATNVGSDFIEYDASDGSLQDISTSANLTGVTAGTVYETRVEFDIISGTGNSTTPVILGGGATAFGSDSAPITFDGVTVDMSEQWEPLTKTLDVLKGIIDLFNLVIIPIEGSKTQLEIHTFDDWFNSGTQLNWNDKWDTSIRRSITHPVLEQPKKLLFQNVEDEDRLSKLALDSDPNYQYGTLEVIADNTISQGEEEVGSYFGPTVLASQTTGSNLSLDTGNSFIFPHLYKFENSEQQAYKFKPRIGFKSQNNLTDNIFVGEPGDTRQISQSYFTLSNLEELPSSPTGSNLHFNTTYTSYIPSTYNQSGSFSNFDKYWKTYIDSLYWDEGRKVTLDVKFEQNEYRDIQLNDIIFIKDTQYRINKIKGFNLTDDDVATVELLKDKQ